MESWNKVLALMAAARDLLQPVELLEDLDRGWWSFLMADDTALQVTYDPTGDSLILAAPLGVPRPAQRGAVYALALAYNGQAVTTGGGTVDLGAPGGDLRLRLARSVAALDADGWRGLLRDVGDVAAGLRGYIGRDGTGRGEVAIEMIRFSAIRA